jgi:hypothetical protein
MGDFVTLTCPTCGGKLQITPDIDRFACTHCGNEHVVKRSEGMIAIRPLAESLTGLQRATDRTAAELGLRRVNDELARIEARHSSASRALAEAQAALDQRRRRRNGLIVAAALIVPAAVFCMGGSVVPFVLASTGKSSMDDSLSTILCIANGLGLLFLILAAVFSVRALRLPRPTLSSSQAKQAAAVAQAEVSASATELQAKQVGILKLRHAASRDEG